MAEEKEHMMMFTKDIDEDQLQWWKETKADIAERKLQLRAASSSLPCPSPMSDGGDGGVHHSTDEEA